MEAEPKRHIYRVTLPDGTVVTRTTKRIYTHAVVVLTPNWKTGELTWGVVGWCGRLDLAQKLQAKNLFWNVRDPETGKVNPAPTQATIIDVDNPR